MKKAVRMFTFVVVLAVALGVTAFALEDSARENFKWSNYSGTCVLSAEPKSVSSSMTVTLSSAGMIYQGAVFEMNGTASFIKSDGTGKRISIEIKDSHDLPAEVGTSESIGRTVTYLDYPSVLAECTYSIPLVDRKTTLKI